MNKVRWTKKEQVKVIGEIVHSGLLTTTKKKSDARVNIIDKIANDLLMDPDFVARKNADDSIGTIKQHIRVWISHLEDGKEKPPLGK